MVLWYLTVKNDEQSWFNHQKRWFITNFMGYCQGDIFHEMDTMTSGVSANWVLHTNDSCIGNIMTNKWIKWATLFSYSNACSFIAFRILFCSHANGNSAPDYIYGFVQDLVPLYIWLKTWSVGISRYSWFLDDPWWQGESVEWSKDWRMSYWVLYT